MSAKADGTLWHRSIATHILGINMPRCLALHAVAIEHAMPNDTQKMRFQIRLFWPPVGFLLAYGGILQLIEGNDYVKKATATAKTSFGDVFADQLKNLKKD